MDYSMHGIGEQFQRKTAYQRQSMPAGTLDWSQRPGSFKRHAEADRISLPNPVHVAGGSLQSLLRRRRSMRRYDAGGLRLNEFSNLLWAAQGVTMETRGFLLRTAPSAGALYPIETYAAVHHVHDLIAGLYHYDVPNHALERLFEGDLRSRCGAAALDQNIAAAADVVFFWTAIFARSKWKYGQRAYRYIYLDAGHIAQNVALAAVDSGLGSCQIAAFYDDEANRILGVDGTEESTIYMTAVGSIPPSDNT